ncbi:hypothetical protein E2C01_039366 [Portunus trituberculatus]|uniref:Uncharacterized protein n=1 Tax=Portunus trituberculatus TaxID=210409 RepID=A0A5B7FDG7_PORTR|nr:hypothetical protein [Portunus trituberculatus]
MTEGQHKSMKGSVAQKVPKHKGAAMQYSRRRLARATHGCFSFRKSYRKIERSPTRKNEIDNSSLRNRYSEETVEDEIRSWKTGTCLASQEPVWCNIKDMRILSD